MKNRTSVLVLGSTGMLGHQVVSYLSLYDGMDVSDISYKNQLSKKTFIVDAMSNISLEEQILHLDPDYIVNCIGVLVKGSQDIARAQYHSAQLDQKNACHYR